VVLPDGSAAYAVEAAIKSGKWEHGPPFTEPRKNITSNYVRVAIWRSLPLVLRSFQMGDLPVGEWRRRLQKVSCRPHLEVIVPVPKIPTATLPLAGDPQEGQMPNSTIILGGTLFCFGLILLAIYFFSEAHTVIVLGLGIMCVTLGFFLCNDLFVRRDKNG
jgi:hypothetical protein